MTDFVLDDRRFPRSVGFCIDGIGAVIRVLPQDEDVDDAHATLDAMLHHRPDGVSDPQLLHEFLDEFQVSLGVLHDVLVGAYFLRRELAPDLDTEDDEEADA